MAARPFGTLQMKATVKRKATLTECETVQVHYCQRMPEMVSPPAVPYEANGFHRLVSDSKKKQKKNMSKILSCVFPVISIVRQICQDSMSQSVQL